MDKKNINLYRISKCQYIDDLTGDGAFRFGGRWNSKGTRMLYTSQSIALSMLEVLVHTNGLPIHKDMCVATFQIKKASILTLLVEDLPAKWNRTPCISATRKIGDDFVKNGQYLAIKVPSVLIPEEYNILLNPLHKDFQKILTIAQREILFDGRL